MSDRCELCHKSYKHIKIHLKNFHVCSSEDIKYYMEKANQRKDVSSHVERVRFEIKNILIDHSAQLHRGLRKMYNMMHKDLVDSFLSIPPPEDVVEGQHDVGRIVEKCLRPSFEHISKEIEFEKHYLMNDISDRVSLYGKR